MRKEYSDLPKEQKSNFILQNVITAICMIFTSLIWVSWLGFQLSHIQLSRQIVESDLFIGLVMLSTFFIVFVGGIIGILIENKLGLHTDFDLEKAQKRLDKIKKALEK